jgi:hypothetical protein
LSVEVDEFMDFVEREAQGLRTFDEVDAVDRWGSLDPKSALAPRGSLKQVSPLVESQGVRGQSGQAGKFTDPVALGRSHHPQYALWS